MFPESVSVRQRGAHDFESCYDNLCALQSSAPLVFVKAHLKNGLLDINGDKVRMTDWSPILNTLKINKNLRYIAIKSYYLPSANNSAKRAHYFRRRAPAIRSKEVTLWIARSLAKCISRSTAIKCLDLQGVPLREKDVNVLARGITNNHSLTHISLNYCQISDTGAQILAQALKHHATVTHVALSGCNITSTGAESISRLIKLQSMQRHSEAWANSLRYRKPNLGCMGGIRRISLNSNPMIGDDGIAAFTEALKDDLWLKALDLQHCGISTEGAVSLLKTVEHNNTISVLDVRRNPMIDSATLRALLGRVLMNTNEKDEVDFPWLKEEPPKDPYKTRKYHPPRSLSKSFGKKVASKTPKKCNPTEAVPEVFPPGHESFVPWRTAVRASQHKYGYSDEEDDEDAEILCLNDDVTIEHSSITDSTTSAGVKDDVAIDEAHLSLQECQSYIKRLKIDLIDTQRRFKSACSNEKHLNNKIMNLQVENTRLRKELSESFENSRMKSQIEDDILLDSIEQSFNKFHDFLNMLNDVGLGGLASAAGLDHEFPFRGANKPASSKFTEPKADEVDEHETVLQVNNTIVIEGNSGSPGKPIDSNTKLPHVTATNDTSEHEFENKITGPTKNAEAGNNCEQTKKQIPVYKLSDSDNDSF